MPASFIRVVFVERKAKAHHRLFETYKRPQLFYEPATTNTVLVIMRAISPSSLSLSFSDEV